MHLKENSNTLNSICFTKIISRIEQNKAKKFLYYHNEIKHFVLMKAIVSAFHSSPNN